MCKHTEIFPNGNCAECGVFVTSVPGLTSHKVVRRPVGVVPTAREYPGGISPEARNALDKLAGRG